MSIETYLQSLEQYGENTTMMRFSIEHLLCSIDYHRTIKEKKGTDVAILPKNIEDISVGDMIYVNLEVNYPNELWYGHWCYVLKDVGSKYLVVPSTSYHEESIDERFDYIIDTVINGELTKSVLSLSDVRFIDKQRIDQRKSVGKVITPKSVIRRKIFEFLEEE